MLTELETYSTIALYSGMIVYAIAFVFYVVDLANRSGDAHLAAPAGAKAQVSGQGGTATLVKPPRTSAPAKQPRSRWLRAGFALTVLGFLLHLAATVLRGIGAEHVPWANMYEFALTATVSAVGIFLIVQFFIDLRFLGTLVTGMTIMFLGIAKINYYVPIVPLVPALDSYWLVIHIIVAVLAVGFFTLSFGLSILQLLQTRRGSKVKAGDTESLAFMTSFPNPVRLEDLAYRLAIIGFAFWTFTLIAGSIWAEAAWSRYWGWDVKEIWTFIIWVLYAGFIHARATRGWRGTRSAWLNIVSYAAVIFNFSIVNVFFKGLHAYSGF